ncbi:MAG: carboxylesterase family protein [Bacteroidaceae bacterium]|nr:carboxylesterase family protein [Bacteroidaceae bacterium]
MRHLVLLVMLVCLCASAQETYRFAERDTCALYLDIFRPDSTAQTTYKDVDKPAIMFLFGGGFMSGSRSDANARRWFSRLTANGYTVVAIDYRLGMKGYRMGKGLGGAMKALNRFVFSQQIGVEDVFSAVSFLAAHPELRVPADNIVISGSSAGAIISLASAYAIANGQTDGLPEGFNFKGVMSFAGGIISKRGGPKFTKAPCPLLLFHGTADRIVAYEHYGALRRGIWGSSYIASKLKKKGWNCTIWRFQDHGHDVAGYMPVMWAVEKEFLEKNVIQGIPRQTDALVDDPSLPKWGGQGHTRDLYQ